MLNYEQSCKEWMKGCSNTIGGHPEDCQECTRVFREHLEKLAEKASSHKEIRERVAKHYYCENGAFHTWYCGEFCWNRHPEAKPDEMFTENARYREIIKDAYIKKAMDSGFTEQQATFLFKRGSER